MESFALKSCFIFCPFLNPSTDKPNDTEIQDAKLLLYYPSNVEKSIQRSNIGIIEGTLSFLKTFDNNENNKVLLTELDSSYTIAKLFEDKIYLVIQIEKKVINVSQFNNIFNKDHWLECLLDNVYDLFYLFHGDFNSNFFPNGKDIREDQVAYNYLTVKFNDFIVCYFEYFANISTPFIDNIQYANNATYILNLINSSLRLNEIMSQMEAITFIYKGRVVYNEIDISALKLLYNLFFGIDSQEKFDKFRAPPVKEYNKQKNPNQGQAKDNKEQYTYHAQEENGMSQKNDFISPFLKAFEIPKGEDKGFLIGLKAFEEESIYHVFIPTIHIKNLNKQYKLLVYSYKELCLFICLSKDFDCSDIGSIIQMAQKIQEMFGIANQKISTAHQFFLTNALVLSYQYIYCNANNYELHFSSLNQIWKGDKERNKVIQNAYEMIYHSPLITNQASVTKLKDNYVYYCCLLEKRYVVVLKTFDSVEIKKRYIAEIEEKMSYV